MREFLNDANRSPEYEPPFDLGKANDPNQDDTFSETENSSTSSEMDDIRSSARPLEEDGEGHLPTESKSMIDIPQEGATFIAPEIGGKTNDEGRNENSSSDDEMDRSKL